jgi:hypothetical protein
MDNLAEMPSNKIIVIPSLITQFPPTWIDPHVPSQSKEEMRRIVGISGPLKSSSGSKLFHTFQEQET